MTSVVQQRSAPISPETLKALTFCSCFQLPSCNLEISACCSETWTRLGSLSAQHSTTCYPTCMLVNLAKYLSLWPSVARLLGAIGLPTGASSVGVGPAVLILDFLVVESLYWRKASSRHTTMLVSELNPLCLSRLLARWS